MVDYGTIEVKCDRRILFHRKMNSREDHPVAAIAHSMIPVMNGQGARHSTKTGDTAFKECGVFVQGGPRDIEDI